jgi:hypothetical protein
MRFKIGLAIGFGAGYYLGAKAGRQRYEQLHRWLQKTTHEVTDVAKDKIVDLRDQSGLGDSSVAERVDLFVATESTAL